MAISHNFSTLTVVLFAVFYTSVFILSTVGNTWVLVTCYKTLRRRHSPFMWLLATLASADLSFTLLTIFTSVGYFQRWIGGNSTCKLQGFLLEASYTTSIITLVIISYQRQKALTDPFSARTRSWPHREFTKLVIIWGLSLTVCSPLLHLYYVRTNKNGELVCVTKGWQDIEAKIYYSLHTTFFFAIPLLYIILTQCRIFHTLRSSVVPVSNLCMKNLNLRHRKTAKILLALSIAFVLCWSPFMITRTLIYFHMASPGLVWRASQLLIFLNAALDPLLYGFFGGNLKSSLRRALLRNNYILCHHRRVDRVQTTAFG